MEPSMTIEEQFKRLNDAKGAKSLMKKYLTKEVFDELKNKKTKYGGTLSQCINSGVEQLDVKIGVRATDPDAYETFSALFNPVIKDYHEIPFDADICHPPKHFGDIELLGLKDLDPSKKYVKSTRVRIGRNLEGFALQSLLSVEDRAEIENKIKAVVSSLDNEYKGEYYSLETMSTDEERSLIQNHFLFNHSNRSSRSAGVYRDWPKNRGIFINRRRNFLIWVSETDHIRIISMQNDGNLSDVYKRLIKGVSLIEDTLKFARSKRLGFITFCPTNLGTTLRASVHIQIPKLAANEELLNKLCERYGLQIRGIDGDGTDITGDTFDISNRRRLGLTEIQAVLEMEAGIKAIIDAEMSLQSVQ